MNRCDVLPATGLRRNSIYYPFITYMNHTIALFLCEEYDAVALFIYRADIELNKLKMKDDCKDRYFAICEQYIQKLSRYMLKNNFLSGLGMQMLPDRFKE